MTNAHRHHLSTSGAHGYFGKRPRPIDIRSEPVRECSSRGEAILHECPSWHLLPNLGRELHVHRDATGSAERPRVAQCILAKVLG